jgi:hypothetical protein
MEPRLLEQDLPSALKMLEFQFSSPDDMVRFWTCYKTRARNCPSDERIFDTTWWKGLF